MDALDVNAVGFIDDTSNIIYSGSDNGIIKVISNLQYLHFYRGIVNDQKNDVPY